MRPRPILLCFSLIIIAGAVAVAQLPVRTITKIEVQGLERLSAAEVIATSELKTGTPLSVAELDAAGQRLVDSGLFTNVAYRTTSKGSQVTVIFEVKESNASSSPVVFDNFVWFTNDELFAAIKRAVPSFNGTVPDAGTAADVIQQTLQDLLKERHLGGAVEHAPSQTGSKLEHLFHVTGVPIPICKLHFPGAKNVSEEKLVMSSRQLTNADYSRQSAIAFSEFILKPIYREAGQLRAQFAEPLPKLADTTDCKGGVDLNIPVAEGPIFLWNKTEWTGNEALTASDLDGALGMKNGEVANAVRIEKGLRAVVKRYGRTGHLKASIDAKQELDDAASRVSYKIAVKEGPQFKMGTLTIKGLEEADVTSLEARWKLKNGEVFDDTYPGRFLNDDAREPMQRIMLARQAQRKDGPTVEITPNMQNLNADVVIQFKN